MRSVQVEFNTVLALRKHKESLEGIRKIEECLPEKLMVGEKHQFDKEGYRIFPINHPIPLYSTNGDGKLSHWPIASVTITRPTPYLDDNENVRTEGYYEIETIFDENNQETTREFLENLVF